MTKLKLVSGAKLLSTLYDNPGFVNTFGSLSVDAELVERINTFGSLSVDAELVERIKSKIFTQHQALLWCCGLP